MRIEYEERGIKEIAESLSQKRTEFIAAHMEGIVDHVLKVVRRRAPKKTGRLAAFLRKRRWGQRLTWHIVEDAQTWWGRFVREETKHGYFIFPNVKKALWWPGLAHPIPWVGPPYTRKHPGTKANPYHLDGVRDAMPGVDLRLARLARALGGEITREVKGL